MKNNLPVTYYVINYDGKEQGLFCWYKFIVSYVLYAIEHNYIPVVDLRYSFTQYFKDDRQYWDNPWEYFFKQPNNVSPDDIKSGGKVILSPHSGWSDNKYRIFPSELPLSKKEEKHPLVMEYYKYMQFNEEIQAYLNEGLRNIFGGEKDVLGIIVRGTDFVETKPKGHAIQPTAPMIIEKVKELQKTLTFKKIYLATEDANIYKEIKNAFGDMLIDNSQYKYETVNGKWIAGISVDRKDHFYNLAKEYLLSVYLLSKCRYLIGGRANGALAAYIMTKGFETYDYVYMWDLGAYGDAPKPAPAPAPKPAPTPAPKPAEKKVEPAKPAPTPKPVAKKCSRRVYLFGFIPLYKITYRKQAKSFKLFNFITLFKVRED